MSNLDAIREFSARQVASERLTGAGDTEIQAMNATAPLLTLIERDTGESGRKSGDRIDFKTCPVCGHSDCFSYYPGTNSWTCFSSSNTSGYNGGTYLEYMKAVHSLDDAEAVRRLREATGNKRAPRIESYEAMAQPLPKWRAVNASDPPERNPILIPGILRKGHVAVLAGKGKVGKTQSAIQLAIAVATNGEWFGHRIASGGKVLHLDPECDAKSLDNRYSRACEVMGVDKAKIDERVFQWPLRGVEDVTIDKVLYNLENNSSYGEFALIIIDSASIFVRGDENSSVDVRRFSAKVMQIARVTGAAVWCVHHFGKAKDGDRSASDRARGSSAWLDFPDASLTLTETFAPNEEESLEPGEYGMILESGGLREFPRMEPVRLIFDGRTHRADTEGVTSDWTAWSSQRAGGKTTGAINKSRAEQRFVEHEDAILREIESRGVESLSAQEAGRLTGVRSDNLVQRIKERSERLEVKKAGNQNYISPKL